MAWERGNLVVAIEGRLYVKSESRVQVVSENGTRVAEIVEQANWKTCNTIVNFYAC
jgi:hypothetical protein